MDTGKGDFLKISNEKFQEQMGKENPMVFKKGEILTIRGSRLRVERILKHKIILKLLPALKPE